MESAMGKTLVLDEYKEPFTVTAVLKDVPAAIHHQFDMLIPTSCTGRSLNVLTGAGYGNR
jgi:hypothetical protein